MNKDIKNKKHGFKNISDTSTMGLTLVFSTFIGMGLGIYLDKVFNSKPLLTIMLLFLGIAAGFINIFRIMKRMG